VIKGSEFSVEFTAIQTAFSLAAPAASPTFTGTVTIPTADINGGAIDGTTIGGTTPAAATFTSVTATTADINGGTIDGATLGGSSQVTITDADMNGGTIDGVVIGGATPAAGSFTTGQFGTSLNVDGTVTADGLSLDASVNYPVLFENQAGSTADAAIGTFDDANGTLVSIGSNFYISNAGAETRFNTGEEASGIVLNRTGTITARTSDGTNNTLARLNIANNGDISFYEDTGTTPKFFWDASQENVLLSSENWDVSAATGQAQIRIVTTSADAGIELNAGNSQPWYIYNEVNDLRFRQDGVDYFNISSSGNVGIGTSSPSQKLQISGADSQYVSAISTNSGNTGILFGDATKVDEGYVLYANGDNSLRFGSAGTERMRITSAGNVGIGTSSPTANLHISDTNAGALGANIKLDNSGSSVGDETALMFASGSVRAAISSAVEGAPDFAGNLVFKTGEGTYASLTERMRIEGSGNVGIGTSSPDAIFESEASITAGIFTSTSSNLHTAAAVLRVRNTGDASVNTLSHRLLDLDYNGDASNVTGTYVRFLTGGTERAGLGLGGDDFIITTGVTERMRIDSSGNLLVGCTALPSSGSGGGAFEAGASSGRTILQLGSTSTATLAVARFYNPNGAVGSITTSGSATAYNTSSDYRLKENIADAEDAGAKVDAIQVRQFDWKADGSHQDYGMIAQELLEVAPEAVSGDPESDDMMGVDYSKLVPMLVKEIQSLRARVAQLEGA
jgi:hypothetical protein